MRLATLFALLLLVPAVHAQAAFDVEHQIAALTEAGELPEQAFSATNDAKGPERISGVIVYDVSDPTAPAYAGFLINRDFSVDAQLPGGSPNPAVGDLGPEGLVFIPAADSPTGRALLVTSNEITGTVTVYALGGATVDRVATPEAPALLRLRGAVPNPASAPSVAFDLAAPADVRLVVFDALGREVSRTERAIGAGADLHLDAHLDGLATGAYLYQLEATAGTETARQSGRLVLTR